LYRTCICEMIEKRWALEDGCILSEGIIEMVFLSQETISLIPFLTTL